MSFIFVFIIGLFIGSFLNVLVDRIPRNESFVTKRSHCEKCGKILVWYDLIPLFSFMFLRGKCRYCHVRLSLYYPTTEMITGILFLATYVFVLHGSQFQISNSKFLINFQFPITIIYYLFLVSSLIVILFTDLKYGIIPDKILFPTILVSFAYILLTTNYLMPILSALGASLFFLLLFLITKGRGMGFGDVKFAFLMGLILGFPGVVIGLYIAFLTGALIGCILIVWRKKKLRGASVPFGPFLILGCLCVIFFQDLILQGLQAFL